MKVFLRISYRAVQLLANLIILKSLRAFKACKPSAAEPMESLSIAMSIIQSIRERATTIASKQL